MMSRQPQDTEKFDVTQSRKEVQDSAYYQNLQKSLAVKTQAKHHAIQKQHRTRQEIKPPDIADKVEIAHAPKSLFNWKSVVNKNGQVEYEVDVASRDNYVTSILTGEKSMGIIRVLGLRIDLREKMQSFIDKYIKNFVQARSHNLMIAQFAQFNVAIMGQMLSMLGMSSADIRKLQKEALANAIEENMSLFAENEYNGEMIEIVGGGSKKEVKAQLRLVNEMRTQFITQMDRLGNQGYYSEARIKEIQIEQIKKIINSFYEEKNHLEFQLHYL